MTHMNWNEFNEENSDGNSNVWGAEESNNFL
jgi:hypothetical protein